MVAYFRDLFALIAEYRRAKADEAVAIAEWRNQLREDMEGGQ